MPCRGVHILSRDALGSMGSGPLNGLRVVLWVLGDGCVLGDVVAFVCFFEPVDKTVVLTTSGVEFLRGGAAVWPGSHAIWVVQSAV